MSNSFSYGFPYICMPSRHPWSMASSCVLYTQCYHCLWIIYSWFLIRFYLTFIICDYFIFFTCFLKTIDGFDIKDQHWSVQTSFSNSNTTTTVESVSYTIVQKSTIVSCSGYWVVSMFLFPTHSWQLKVQFIFWYKNKKAQ